MRAELPLPKFFDESKADKVYQIDYMGIAGYAEEFAKQHSVPVAATDSPRIIVMIIDGQLTFCNGAFELPVLNAIPSMLRTVKFGYRELQNITKFALTMDTHFEDQIFYSITWVNDRGEHPAPGTMITYDDVKNGVWKINPAIAGFVTGGNLPYLMKHALHYTKTLQDGGKYSLTIWPYHAMLGGIGHALVPILHEMTFFHDSARYSGIDYEIKGGNLLTENYSIIAPEVTTQWDGNPLGQVNVKFFENLMSYDYVVIAGQAKSHCVAWTIQDILDRILAKDPNLAKKIYLLEDCTDPVIIPGVIDFTKQGDDAFERFANAGMHIVKSTTPIKDWPGVR
jgi:nicotinamidase-related amidase